jgi:hypothetical protein
MESAEKGVDMPKFHSSMLSGFRTALRRHLEKFDDRYSFRVDTIDWSDDALWVTLRVNHSETVARPGDRVGDFEVLEVVPGAKKPYVLKKGRKEFVAGARLVENMKGRHK